MLGDPGDLAGWAWGALSPHGQFPGWGLAWLSSGRACLSRVLTSHHCAPKIGFSGWRKMFSEPAGSTAGRSGRVQTGVGVCLQVPT